MTDQRSTDRRSGPVVATLVVLCLLPVLYALSMGPVNWLVTNDYVDSDRVRWFYVPLIYLAENNTLAAKLFVWYLSLFGNV